MKKRSVEEILALYKNIVVPSGIVKGNIQNIINFQEIGEKYGDRSYCLSCPNYRLEKLSRENINKEYLKTIEYLYQMNRATNYLKKVDELKDSVNFQTISAFKAGYLFSNDKFNKLMVRANITEQDRIIHYLNRLSIIALYLDPTNLSDDVKEKIIKCDQYVDRKLSSLKRVVNSSYGYEPNYDSEVLPVLINKFIFSYRQKEIENTFDCAIDEAQVERVLKLI